jgi:hypothetical protein
MKTPATLKEATAILALCAAMTFSLTSCDKDEMITPANGTSFQQASGTDASQPTTTELNSEGNRLQSFPVAINRSPRRHDNTTGNGTKVFKTDDTKKAPFNEPAIARTIGSNPSKPEHEPVSINSATFKAIPMNTDVSIIRNTQIRKNEPAKN